MWYVLVFTENKNGHSIQIVSFGETIWMERQVLISVKNMGFNVVYFYL